MYFVFFKHSGHFSFTESQPSTTATTSSPTTATDVAPSPSLANKTNTPDTGKTLDKDEIDEKMLEGANPTKSVQNQTQGVTEKATQGSPEAMTVSTLQPVSQNSSANATVKSTKPTQVTTVIPGEMSGSIYTCVHI